MAQNGPVDGYGGFLYEQIFNVPSYDTGEYTGHVAPSTYKQIDFMYHYNQRLLSGYAILFGILFMALLQLTTLTPASKRGLPLFTFNCLAILCEMVRQIAEIIEFSYSGYSSAYFLITQDFDGANMSAKTKAPGVIIQICAPLAFMFIQFCFFIQARAVLSAFRTTHKFWHNMILGTLSGLGAVAFFYRIFEAINEILVVTKVTTWVPSWTWLTADGLYAASIGGWSAVFSAQVGMILHRRAKLGGSIRRSEALNILFLTGIESMVLPIFFCILQWFPTAYLVEPQILIIPAVCVLIPFGSLWAGSLSTYDKQKHTFTRSILNEAASPAKLSIPSPNTSATDPTSPQRPDPLLEARSQSAYTTVHRPKSVSKAAASSSAASASPRLHTPPPAIPGRNPYRPSGLLDAELYDATELQEHPASPNTRDLMAAFHEATRPYTPRPSRADPSRPDEMV